jgi:hypothetical protein
MEEFKITVISQEVNDKFIMKKIYRNDLTKVISRKDIASYPEDLQKTIIEGCKIAMGLNTIHQEDMRMVT